MWQRLCLWQVKKWDAFSFVLLTELLFIQIHIWIQCHHGLEPSLWGQALEGHCAEHLHGGGPLGILHFWGSKWQIGKKEGLCILHCPSSKKKIFVMHLATKNLKLFFFEISFTDCSRNGCRLCFRVLVLCLLPLLDWNNHLRCFLSPFCHRHGNGMITQITQTD